MFEHKILVENYEEAKKKAEVLEIEYGKLKNRCEGLESDLFKAKSQIKSMKIALTYSDSYVMRRETEMRDEIERLKEMLSKKTEKKRIKEQKLNTEIVKKSKYIDDLMVKVQTLHQKAEYYKEDLFKYQDEYSKTKSMLEQEITKKEHLSQSLHKTSEKLSSLQEEINTLNSHTEALIVEKETKIKEVIEKASQNAASDIEDMTSKFIKEKESYIREQTEKLHKIQELHSETLKGFKKFIENKTKDIRSYYEGRISELINEVSKAEGKHQAEICWYEECISKLQQEKNVLGQVNEFLVIKAEEKHQEKVELEHVIGSLVATENQEVLQSKISKSRVWHEMEDLKMKFEEKKQSLVDEYEKLLRLNQKTKEIEINGLAKQYKENVTKVKNEAANRKFKKKEYYEVQIKFLLEKIESMEKEKAEIEGRIHEQSAEENKDYKNKIVEYEEKISSLISTSNEKTTEIEKQLKYEFGKYYRGKILRLKEKYEKLSNEKEVSYAMRINQLQLFYEDKIKEAIEVKQREFEKEESQKIFKIKELEDKLGRLRTEFKNKINDSSEKIQDLTYEVEYLNKQIFQKQNSIEEMEKEFNSRLQFKDIQIEETNILLDKVNEDFSKSKREVQKEVHEKLQEQVKKYEVEKQEYKVKRDASLRALKKFYEDKIEEIERRHDEEIKKATETSNSTIENLSQRLTSKIRVVKNQKSEINSLRLHVKYMDSTVKIFSPPSRSPTTPVRQSSESTRKGFLLRTSTGARVKHKL